MIITTKDNGTSLSFLFLQGLRVGIFQFIWGKDGGKNKGCGVIVESDGKLGRINETSLLELIDGAGLGQTEEGGVVDLRTGGVDGVGGSKVDPDRETERRFSRGLGAEDTKRTRGILEEIDAEVDGDVLDGRGLVLPSAIRGELATLIIDELLCEEIANARQEATDGLANVDGRVETLATVVEDVAADDLDLSGEDIDLDL